MNLRRDPPFHTITQEYVNLCKNGSYLLEIILDRDKIKEFEAFVFNNNLFWRDSLGVYNIRLPQQNSGLWRLTFIGPLLKEIIDILEKKLYEIKLIDFNEKPKEDRSLLFNTCGSSYIKPCRTSGTLCRECIRRNPKYHYNIKATIEDKDYHT
jgi:hypothetical protein